MIYVVIYKDYIDKVNYDKCLNNDNERIRFNGLAKFI